MNVDVRHALQPLRFRYAAPLQRRLVDFWSWWTGELITLLPENARNAIARRRQKLFLQADGDGLTVNLGSYANSREILRLPLDAAEAKNDELPRDVQQTILVMPADKVLSKSLTLPLATEENLREVLAFEMDRHTPFPASKVYYDFVVTGRTADRQEISVDLVYAPRSAVDTLLESTSLHGLKVDVVTCRHRDNNNLQPLNLLPQEQRRARRINVHRLNTALAALCVVLLVTAIMLPIVQKNRAILVLEEQVQVAATTARDGNQLRRDLETMAAASRFLTDKKGSETMVVQLIDEVSRILPDHAWVTRLDLSKSELQLQGQSSSSSSLIAIIESSPRLENARFRSPVVQIPGTNLDRFQLSADIVEDPSQ
ncbi:MAG: PilN domain-containing protein [Gammaproteobacteria bacterium]|nr:PilN domain-containing protein [Gammaproteobacteria bacterium]